MRVMDLFGSEDRRANKTRIIARKNNKSIIDLRDNSFLVKQTRTMIQNKNKEYMSRGHKACDIFRQNDRTLI